MRKILFVTGNIGKGGAQRVLTLLANEYAEKGWDTHIVSLEKMKVSYKVNSNIAIHTLGKKKSNISSVPSWIKGLKNELRTLSPDVVVSFVGRVNIITMFASMGMNIPIILSERNDPMHDRRNKLEQWLCKKLYSKANKVVFQTNYQKEYYGKACANNGVIIGNPIAAEIYEGEHELHDIICVGKLMEQKNHAMMIEAFSKIANHHPEIHVHIYGEGKEREPLQMLINGKELEERIKLEGNCDEIFEILQKNKFFVMCSDYEGLSNALLEAMMSGMVCVSSNWDGVEDIIEDKVNGYITPKGNPEKLAELLDEILSCGDGLTEISKNAIQTASKYRVKCIIQEWFEEVESCIQ